MSGTPIDTPAKDLQAQPDARPGLRLDEPLLALWREALGIPDAGMDENFFDAGGSSLLAVRLARRMTAHLGMPVAAADILAHPTVRQLARKLSGSEPALDRTASGQRAALQRKAFAVPRPVR